MPLLSVNIVKRKGQNRNIISTILKTIPFSDTNFIWNQGLQAYYFFKLCPLQKCMRKYSSDITHSTFMKHHFEDEVSTKHSYT